jgi:hypothetical protein
MTRCSALSGTRHFGGTYRESYIYSNFSSSTRWYAVLSPIEDTKSIIKNINSCGITFIKWNQWVNPATSLPSDDVHHYVIPPKLLLTNGFYFQQTSGTHAPVGKRKGGSLSGRSPAPIADSFNFATIARKHRVLSLREINRNNTHTALASVLIYYGWVSLIC